MNSKNDFLLSLYSHRDFCVNYLIKKTKCDLDIAENVFIDSILDLQEKNMDFNDIKNLRSYLLVTNLNHWKRVYTKVKKQNESKAQIEMYFYHYLPHLNKEENDDDFLEQKQQVINKAFQQLTDKCRSILSSFYLENKTMSEIAETHDFNTSSVATTLKYRCINRLKKIVFDLDKLINK